MDSSQLQRVQTISELIRRAKMATQENTESANGLAISLMHDAIEHALYLTLLDAHQAPKPREEFKELVTSVSIIYRTKTGKDMAFQRQLIDLNVHRVAFKHRGTRPTKSTTLEAYSNGSEFIKVLFEDVYGLKIDDFHPLEGLRIAAIRDPLKFARSLSEEGNCDEAMCQIAIANHRLDEAFGAVFAQPRAPLGLSSPFGDDSQFRRDLLSYLADCDKHTLVTAVLVASGLDVSAHTNMRWRLPVVYALLDGSFRFDKIVPQPYTAEDVQGCLDQVARVTIWMEERFPALRYEDAKWSTGTISPWPT